MKSKKKEEVGKMINAEKKVRQSRIIDATELDGEKVMMNLELGKYFALNSVGSRIWDIIEEEIQVKDVVEILLKEYNVDKKQCEESVIKYLGLLENEKLIEVL